MKVGQKSLLFGVHQFIWHPLTVLLAWIKLFGLPTWKELICIIIHDWGYWFSPNMDGKEGLNHPEVGAKLALRWFGIKEYELVLFHSRHYAKKFGREPSKLCWADKLSIMFEPWWFYLPRAWMTGELIEYRQNASNFVSPEASNRVWFTWVKKRLQALGNKQSIDI